MDILQKRFGVLMCAAKNNRQDVLEELLELLDRVDLEMTDTEDNTCLHHAAAAGHAAVVDRLLALGARINAANKVICSGILYREFRQTNLL